MQLIHSTALVCALPLVFLLGRSERGGHAPPPESDTCRLTEEQLLILSHMSLVRLDDGTGDGIPTLRISGLNVQIVNGLGATNGYPDDPRSTDPRQTAVNGAGNLIVGYNELFSIGVDRTGSHNIVAGFGGSYRSYGGMVVGYRNESQAPYASVSGGERNRATGTFSWVGGGHGSEASGDFSSVAGGGFNTAKGVSSCVFGGGSNQALADASTIFGGRFNRASGYTASVIGGIANQAIGDHSNVTGGTANQSQGRNSTVSGGANRTAPGENDWLAGTLFEDQ